MANEELRRTNAGDIRQDVFTTLAIGALLHGDNRTLQKIAANLAKRAPGSLRKNTLLPLSTSPYAHEIIMESAVYPVQEKVIGTARYNGEEYDITINWRHLLDYTAQEVLGDVADILIQRGFIHDRAYIEIIDPVYRGIRVDSILLSDHAKYSVQNYNGIQLEA